MMQNDDFALVLQDVVLNNGGKNSPKHCIESTWRQTPFTKVLRLALFLEETLRFWLDVWCSFSEKATKICAIFLMVWSLLSICPNHDEDCKKFCGLLRKAELYLIILQFIFFDDFFE